MKGISTVIATLLMLMITIALAGMAYMYISGVFTMQTQGIELVDAYCVGNNVTMVVRNIGTAPIPAGNITCAQTAPETNCTASLSSTLNPGSTATLTDSCGGSGARTCSYRLIPLIGGRPVTVNVPCY
jgi:flagellin-like protein